MSRLPITVAGVRHVRSALRASRRRALAMLFAAVPPSLRSDLAAVGRKHRGNNGGGIRSSRGGTAVAQPAPRLGYVVRDACPFGRTRAELHDARGRPVFARLLRGTLFHSRQTGVGVKDFSGPPGILAMLAAELKADYRLGLQFMVLLNVSLACFNLLPLPVLDGGHIAMAVVEKLRGRPLSPRIQEYATTAFALLLISFMLYVSYNDLAHRLPLFHSLFDQQVQIQDGPGGTNAAVEPKP